MTQTETLGKTLTSLAQEVQVQGPKRIGILGGVLQSTAFGPFATSRAGGEGIGTRRGLVHAGSQASLRARGDGCARHSSAQDGATGHSG